MLKRTTSRTVTRSTFALIAFAVAGGVNDPLLGQSASTDLAASENAKVEEQRDEAAAMRETKEPVFRVSKLNRGTPANLIAGSMVAVAEPASAVGVLSEIADRSRSNELLSALPTAPATAIDSSSINPSDVVPSATAAPHSLDRAIQMAKDGLVEMQANVKDYSAIMVKRERVNGVLSCSQYVKAKIRCPRTIEGRQVPFSVYLKFLKPRKVSGREVIWIEGQNDNKLCVHETGLMGMKRFYLDPNGYLAMRDNRYPISDVGIENLMLKLIERAERDKAAGPCEVVYREHAEIMKRPCRVIELKHDEKRPPFDFHKAQVFIDKEMNLPVRFVSYDWPKTPGAKPEIIEEYTYIKVNLNQGFTDIDFDPNNTNYKYPSR